MGFRAFNYGANIIAIKKNNYHYGMTCSWAMQVDYDKVIFLLGAQSITASIIKKNDLIGVSALNQNQSQIALKFGSTHSHETNKFLDIEYFEDDSCLFIKGSSRLLKVKVIELIYLTGIESDTLVYGQIVWTKENDTPFLSINDL